MKHQLLILEDDQTLADSWEEALGNAGYQVSTAHDGLAAEALWRESPFDVVILDLKTPKKSGGELMDLIKKARPWTQIIIISGQGDENDKIDALKHHVFDYLEKPASLKTIFSAVEQALSNRDLVTRGLEAMVDVQRDAAQAVITFGDRKFTAQQLYEEVQKGTEVGLRYREMLEQAMLDEGRSPVKRTGYRSNWRLE